MKLFHVLKIVAAMEGGTLGQKLLFSRVLLKADREIVSTASRR